MKTTVLAMLLLLACGLGAYSLAQASAGLGGRPYDALALACGVAAILVLAFA